MSQAKQLYSLTGLRFCAAMCVALFHFSLLISYPPVVKAVIASGSAGVSFFFVLSGFVILYAYRQQFSQGVTAHRYGEFMGARFARIYPMYLVSLVLITTITLACFCLRPSLLDEWGEMPAKAVVSSWVANLFLVQIYYPTIVFEQFWNAAAWSLSCEVAFYAAFPFIAWGITNLQRRGFNIVRLILGLFIIELAAYFAGVVVVTKYPPIFPIPQPDWNYNFIATRLPLFRIWEFAIGCCLAALLVNPAKTSPTKWLATVGGRNAVLCSGLAACGVLVYAKALLSGTVIAHEIWTMFRWGIFDFALYTLPFGLIIVSLAAGPTLLSRVLENPFIVLLGEASYSLYILHIGTWRLVDHLQHVGVFPGSWFPALALVATIPISIFCYKYIEMPARSKLRSAFEHWFGLRPARSMVTAAGGSQNASARAA